MKIGVLTSGGDAPGMNACIRAVVRKGIYDGHEVVGFNRGFIGVMAGEIVPMNPGSVADIIHRGGTFLYSGRSDRFKTPEGLSEGTAVLRREGIDGLVVIGGDGSLRACKALAERGIRVVFIPGSIDNDIPCTDLSIGFDTALNTILDAVNKLRDTATAFERTFIVEVMGRSRGFLALAAGIAGGAESILIPEFPVDMGDVCERLLKGYKRGKKHSMIIVAEGVGTGFSVADEITKRTGFETRVAVLGHIQRGGTPSGMDRVLASKMGARAVETLAAGKHAVMTGMIGLQIREFDIDFVLSQNKEIDLEDYRLASVLAT